MTEKPTSLNESVEFAENPEPRCACILLLDTSASMHGEPIAALNEGLQIFQQELNKDQLAKRRVEVAVMTFDDKVTLVQDFVTADQFAPPRLSAKGTTFMGTGILRALELLHQRKTSYRNNGVAYFRPWIFMITDGEPQGEPEEAVRRAAAQLRDEEKNHRLVFFAVGVQNANMQRLAQIVPRTPVKLVGLKFVEMFVWLSKSTQAVSKSQITDQVALPPPGWAAV